MKTKQAPYSIGFMLFLTFMILKLTEVIDWSWWWVLSPIWIPVAIFILIVICAYVRAMIESRE